MKIKSDFLLVTEEASSKNKFLHQKKFLWRLSFKIQFKIEFMGPFARPRNSLEKNPDIEHPVEENHQRVSSLFQKTCLKNEEICCITSEGKTTKNEWENDDSAFLRALYSVYKK